MLTKDLLRVSRRGGGYSPQFVGQDRQSLAARVIGCYQGHVGEPRERLQEALTAIERDSEDFKLVRGFAKLIERDTTWEVRAPISPRKARQAAFLAGEQTGVVTESQRTEALTDAAARLDVTRKELEESLYADLDRREILTAVESRWKPNTLIDQYNLSLAQTALFDATEMAVQSSDPKRLVSAVKRLGLLYEIHREGNGEWTLHLTGPDALFRSTRRYGTQFARLLRTVTRTDQWHLTATIDDRGTERSLTLSDADPISVPETEPVTEDKFDSNVEASFATRFESLDFDWRLEREPEPLAAGDRVMIPDFVFDHEYGDCRIFFEIMGFWTPEYVEKKLAQLDAIEDLEMLVAVDESLGVSEEIETRDHRAITYEGSIRLKEVRNALRPYEQEIDTASKAALPETLSPDEAVITLERLADRHGVSDTVIEDVSFPDHERIGRTLVEPEVLEAIEKQLDPGISLSETAEILTNHGITETSAVLAALGYEVAWEGLDGGTLQPKSG